MDSKKKTETKKTESVQYPKIKDLPAKKLSREQEGRVKGGATSPELDPGALD